MTLFQSGIVKANGSQVFSSGQPFNVDVIKESYTDPYSSSVVLYLKGDSLTDASVFNRSISVAGNPVPVTFQGRKAIYFDGISRLSISNSLNISLNNNDFTLEFWLFLNPYSDEKQSYQQYLVFDNQDNFSFKSYQGYYYFFANNYTNIKSNIQPIVNQWHHLALVRTGTTLSLFINGTLNANASISIQCAYNLLNIAYIGSFPDMNEYLKGYLSEFRLTKGIGRYTANFTPLSTFSGDNYHLVCWR